MKRILTLALAGLGLTASCTTASLAQGYPVAIQGDLPAVQEREAAQAVAAAECVIGRHAMIADYIAANRVSALAPLAALAGAAQQMLQIPAQVLATPEGNE